MAGYAFDRLLTTNTPLGVPTTGKSRVRDWIDSVVPAGNPVGVLAYPLSRDWGQSAIQWWDAEFWNNRARRAFVVPDGTYTYTPFPSTVLRLDFATGRFAGTDDAPPFVLAAPNDSRFGLAGAQTAANVGLVLRQVDRPYRAQWATRGLDSDGWTRPGRPATIRVYAAPDAPAQACHGHGAARRAAGGGRAGLLPAGRTARDDRARAPEPSPRRRSASPRRARRSRARRGPLGGDRRARRSALRPARCATSASPSPASW